MRLRVDGVGRDVRDDLPPLGFQHLLALLRGNLYFSLLEDLAGDLGDVHGAEGLLGLLLGRARTLGSVLKNVLYRHIFGYVELLALFDKVHNLGV